MNENIVQTSLFKRLKPKFLIIGAQKCGTTSLYNYLIKHPQIVPALQKEVHFFDIHFKKGINWYLNQFPIDLNPNHNCITGEASPYYLFHPYAPNRIFKYMPNIKLIVLLRNPVDRAYSHYHQQVSRGNESLSFEEAIKMEETRLKPEIVKMLNDENYYSPPHQRHSYLARGLYVEQLKVWMKLYSKEQFLIIKSEDFYLKPEIVLNRVINFLGLPEWKLNQYSKDNSGNYPQLDFQVKRELSDYFKPYNIKLYNYLGEDFGWY